MAAAAPLPASAFQRAVDSFKKNAGMSAKDLHQLEITSLPDLWRAVDRIQKDQRDSKKMMHLKRLGPFLNAMEQYGKVLDVFVNVSNFVAFIWGPIKFLLVATSNFSEAFNGLLDGYSQIGENIPQLVQYQQLFEKNAYMQNALVSIFEDILEFHREAVRYFKQKVWKQLFQATWRAMSMKIDYLIKSLQQHKALIEGQATIIQLQEFQNLRAAEKARFENLMEAEQMRRRINVLQWLGAINSAARQDDALKRRHVGTGDWILRDQRFQQWFSVDHCMDPLLWLNGIPGAGKTVLASIIIQEAKRLAKAKVAFFYCKNTDEQSNGFVNVARSILSQLLVQNDTLLLHLYETASKCGEAMLTSENLAKDLLETAVRSTDKVYIVLDGLDEYSRNDRKEISAWFQSIVQSIPTQDLGAIRCIFISQDDGYARKDFKSLFQIKLTAKDNQKDIEIFCKHWHQRIEAKFGPLLQREHNITNVVPARAQGMFLYAKLVTWNLYEQTTRAELEAELDPNRLPDGLDQVYARITERLFGIASKTQARNNSTRSNNASKLLGWLSCAKRPMRWYEIQGATSIDTDQGIVSPDRKFKEDCKDLCASLVEINSDGSVSLVHATVKGFLIREGYIRPPEVECDLATLCIGYLSCIDFEVGRAKDEIQDALLQGYYSFADYAICFWALHAETAISKHEEYDAARFSLLTESLDVFLDARWSGSSAPTVVSRTLKGNLSSLETHACYDQACEALAATKNQLRPTGKEPSDDDDPLQVYKANKHIRNVLEKMASSNISDQDIKTRLTEYYGPNWFKCGRLNCQFFHVGFATEGQREQHVSKHERAFTCSVDGCPQAIIGCTTAKSLEKHIFESHGIRMTEQELKFPEELEFRPESEKEEEAKPLKEKEEKAKSLKEKKTSWDCDLCPKKFTRGHNLRNHKRSHTNDRPFDCRSCGKRFARKYDRARHESLHNSINLIICEGELKDGRKWGCKKVFTRNDKLIRHLKSESGRSCLDALWEEPQSSDSSVSSSQHLPTYKLPAALLQRYPALASIQRVCSTQSATGNTP